MQKTNPMKRFYVFSLMLMLSGMLIGQNAPTNQITPDMLKAFRTEFKANQSHVALQNAVTSNPISKLSVNRSNQGTLDKYFTYRVKSSGITDQKSSGRCWMFASMNVLRAQVIKKYKMKDFYFSHNYTFFYDQLEKANLFLQEMINNASKPMDDRTVEWLFKNPIGDGGVWSGFVNITQKYGIVPQSVMPETAQTENTGKMSQILALKLREDGLKLRELAAAGSKPYDLVSAKTKMLSEIFQILALCMGEPPSTFSWRYENSDGNISESKTYSPLAFYNEFVGVDLNDYVMLMDDPSRDYNKVYTIQFDRNTYEGTDWKYLNLPVEKIKEYALNSIRGDEALYFSCDVGQQLDKDKGILDINNFAYDKLFGTSFGMNKKQRIVTFESSSSHGMTLVAADVDSQGKTKKWLLENSWGESGFNGHLIMTDQWFDEYMFRTVVHKKYIDAKTLELLSQKPILLPPWDPMFSPEE